MGRIIHDLPVNAGGVPNPRAGVGAVSPKLSVNIPRRFLIVKQAENRKSEWWSSGVLGT